MKKIVLLILFLVGLFNQSKIYAALKVESEYHFELKGRAAGETAVMSVAEATNMTTFPVRFIPDYSTGNYYVLELYEDGRFVYGRKFYISDLLITNILRHKNRPLTAESINDVCMSQAAAMQDVFRRGLALERAQIAALAENLENLKSQEKKQDDCNCENDPDLRQNYDRYKSGQQIGGLNDGRILVSDEYARSHFDYDALKKNPQVSRTWLGKNWWWVIPVGLVVGYLAADYFSDGELDGNFTRVTKIKVFEPGDPNNPNNPNHNPNARYWGGGMERPIKNIALDSRAQFSLGSGGIRIPFLGRRTP